MGNSIFVYSANVRVTSSPRDHARYLFHTLVVARIEKKPAVSAHIVRRRSSDRPCFTSTDLSLREYKSVMEGVSSAPE